MLLIALAFSFMSLPPVMAANDSSGISNNMNQPNYYYRYGDRYRFGYYPGHYGYYNPYRDYGWYYRHHRHYGYPWWRWLPYPFF